MVQNKSRRARAAFTLIELLVVIAIIAILVSLTAAAVMKILGKGPEVVARNDINGLSQGLGGFKQQFNVTYVPSQVLLREDGAYNLNNQIEKDTVTFLQAIFGKRLDLRPFNAATGAGNDWNGNGVQDGPLTLTGDQCLVFFLGGIPSPGSPAGCLGFSTSPTNPASAGGTRAGPFFDFKSNNLILGGNGYFSYKDAFGKQPYAFFSSYKKTNGYNRYGVSDCPTLIPFGAYVSGANFVNSNGFQIISAGADGNFGNPANWNPTNGYPPADAGADDFSNFSSARLGTSQQN